MVNVDVAARAHQRQPRARRAFEAAAQCHVLAGGGGKHVLRRPSVPGAVTKRAGPEQHGVRARAQQTHEESVRRRVPADDAPRRCTLWAERHDAVD